MNWRFSESTDPELTHDFSDSSQSTGEKATFSRVLTSAPLDERSGARLYFKCENFQKCGAFKARGCYEIEFQPFAAAGQTIPRAALTEA